MQAAKGLQTIILDKTGTITKGKPELTDIVTTGGFKEQEVLRLAAGVEKSSEHPLAAAIVESLTARPLREFLQEEMFGPLGLTQTFLGLGGRSLDALVQGDVPITYAEVEAAGGQERPRWIAGRGMR